MTYAAIALGNSATMFCLACYYEINQYKYELMKKYYIRAIMYAKLYI